MDYSQGMDIAGYRGLNIMIVKDMENRPCWTFPESLYCATLVLLSWPFRLVARTYCWFKRCELNRSLSCVGYLWTRNQIASNSIFERTLASNSRLCARVTVVL